MQTKHNPLSTHEQKSSPSNTAEMFNKNSSQLANGERIAD